MNNKILGYVCGAAFLFFWIGIGVASIGNMSGPAKPFPWYMPFLFVAIIVPPFIFGFLAGKDDG